LIEIESKNLTSLLEVKSHNHRMEKIKILGQFNFLLTNVKFRIILSASIIEKDGDYFNQKNFKKIQSTIINNCYNLNRLCKLKSNRKNLKRKKIPLSFKKLHQFLILRKNLKKLKNG